MNIESVPFFMIIVDYEFLEHDSAVFVQKVKDLSELPPRKDICVQLRARSVDEATSRALAKCGSEEFSNEVVPLFWNGEVDIAIEFGYDGCHHPESDLFKTKYLEDGVMHSASVHNRVALNRAEELGMRFVLFGSVFKPTWKSVDAQGLKGLQEIAHVANIPVLGIGGIQRGNLKSVSECGAHGFACLSTVIGSNEPVREALHFIAEWEEAGTARN